MRGAMAKAPGTIIGPKTAAAARVGGRGTLDQDWVESSSLQDGEHTACALPSSLRDFSWARGRCLPQRKHDIVAAPKAPVAEKGEPATFER